MYVRIPSSTGYHLDIFHYLVEVRIQNRKKKIHPKQNSKLQTNLKGQNSTNEKKHRSQRGTKEKRKEEDENTFVNKITESREGRRG